MAPALPEPTDPQPGRRDVFLTYLDFFRERAVGIVENLPAGDVTGSRLPSGWTPVQLLHHLRHVERRWLEWGFLGAAVADPWADEHSGRWHVPDGLDLPAVVAGLREQGVRTRAIVEGHELDAVGRPGPRWRGAEPATLERVLFHLLQEYARHVGQLDVVVELATGRTGE